MFVGVVALCYGVDTRVPQLPQTSQSPLSKLGVGEFCLCNAVIDYIITDYIIVVDYIIIDYAIVVDYLIIGYVIIVYNMIFYVFGIV